MLTNKEHGVEEWVWAGVEKFIVPAEHGKQHPQRASSLAQVLPARVERWQVQAVLETQRGREGRMWNGGQG